MKALAAITDRLVTRFVPKTTAAAVCVIDLGTHCAGSSLYHCYKDRCELEQWCNYVGKCY